MTDTLPLDAHCYLRALEADRKAADATTPEDRTRYENTAAKALEMWVWLQVHGTVRGPRQ